MARLLEAAGAPREVVPQAPVVPGKTKQRLTKAQRKELYWYNFRKEGFVVLTSSFVFTTLSTCPMVVASRQQAEGGSIVETFKMIYRESGFKGYFKGFMPRWATLGGSVFVVSNVLHMANSLANPKQAAESKT